MALPHTRGFMPWVHCHVLSLTTILPPLRVPFLVIFMATCMNKMRCLQFLLPFWLFVGIALAPTIPFAQAYSLDTLKASLRSSQPDSDRVQLLCDIAWELKRSGGESPLPYLVSALELAQRLHYKKGIALANVQLGVFYQHNGKYHLAEMAYSTALVMRMDMRDTLGVSNVHNNLGELKKLQGDYIASGYHFKSALEYAQSKGDSTAVARISSQLCLLHKTLGDFNTSLVYGYRSLSVRENLPRPDSSEIGKSYMAIAGTYEYMGQNERAKDAYETARKCFKATHNLRELSAVLNNLGNIEEYSSNYTGALDYYRQSYSYRLVLFDTLNAIKTLRNTASCYRSLKEFSRAEAELREALDLLKSTQDRTQATILQADLAELHLWQGRPNQTVAELTALIPRLDSLVQPSIGIHFRHMLSLASASLQDWGSSLELHLAAERLRHQLDIETNAGLYQYDKYLATARENDRIKAEKEILKRDLEIEKGKRRLLWLALIGVGMLLLALLGASRQRIQVLHSKRKATEALLALEKKEREVERLEQANHLEFLQVSLEVEDRERSRIALDLHDRVGAQMAAVKFLFGQLRDEVMVAAPELAPVAEKLNGELQDLMAEVRAVSHDLESPTLKKFGLVEAIKGFKDMFAKAPNLDFELDVHGLDERLSPILEKHVYLILKELFSNATHHGKATMFSIQLLREGRHLTVLVEDNGTGFDLNQVASHAGLGLQSIRNRVESVKGSLQVDSVIGRGTIVTIEISLIEKQA
jgi:two-component system NarL family sensor kinase